MPIEFHRDGPWDLPEGWVWARLGDLCDFVGRGRGPTYVEDGGVAVVNQKCVRWRKFEDRFLRQTARSAFERLPPHLRLQEGDVLWNSTGTGTIGRAVVYDGHLDEATVDSHITIVRPRWIDPGFVCSYIETMRIQHLVTDEHVGSTNQQELPRTFVQELLVPVPPEAEQRRILTRIDELFTDIADGETALARACDDLDAWRRALLKAAVTGELTREWRKHNKSNETGADLIKRMRREADLVTGDLDFDPEPCSDDLPNTWAWCKIEEAGQVKLGRQRAPQHHNGQHMRPYLRVANVLENALDLSDVKWMNFTPDEFQMFALKPGDILLNEGQTPDLLGRPAIYNGEIENCCFQKTLLRFRPNLGVLPEFALLVFRHYMRSGRFRRESRITTNMAHLTQVRFVVIEFPIPPTEEQVEIVRRFRLLDGDAAEPFDHIGAFSIAALRQSVLKSAFEGRLVDQDLGDESAELLLARLSEQSEATTQQRRTPRSKYVALAAE